MSAPEDMLTVTLRRDEWGRVRQAMRMLRRKAEKDVNRPGFDPALAPGALARRDAAQCVARKLKAQIGDDHGE